MSRRSAYLTGTALDVCRVIGCAIEAQLHTYLKVTGLSIGLLLNFNTAKMTDGVRRRLL